MAIKPGWEGRYFEDFEVGDVYRCRLGRTVTEADNIWFTLLTNNTNQIHFNNEYGKRTEFGKCLINSALTLAIVFKGTGEPYASTRSESTIPGLALPVRMPVRSCLSLARAFSIRSSASNSISSALIE